MEATSPLLPSSFCEQALRDWVTCLTNRFPSRFDSRLLKGLHKLFGGVHSSLLVKRSSSHFKRVLLTQFFLQKKIEENFRLGKGDCVFIKIFNSSSRLCVSLVIPQKSCGLMDEMVLSLSSQIVPSLKKVPLSTHQWTCQEFSYTFHYMELEKMRGVQLPRKELYALEQHLKEKLHHYMFGALVFWPYNHEETFKQLILLEKEIASAEDAPQVILNFQKQTPHHLEFLVCLVRSKKRISKSSLIASNHFPSSAQLISRVSQEFNSRIPSLAEAFSLVFPIEQFRRGGTINLLLAREFVATLLENVVGSFRDYNGGLFETQKSEFQKLAEAFSKNIPNFSLFGEALFYALVPIEAQLCLDQALWEKLFDSFSKAFVAKGSFLNQPNQPVFILKSQDGDQMASYLEKAKQLHKEGEIRAYANLEVLSEHYLCLLNRANDLANLQDQFSLDSFPSFQKRVLCLSFSEGIPPSLRPYYLGRELRGRTLVKLLFEGLMRLNTKSQLEYAGCEEVICSKNNRRYVFTLRPHRWSNGKRVTAFHYEAAWRENFFEKGDFNPFSCLKNGSAIKAFEKPIESLGVKALDKDVLQVDLEESDPHFLKKLAHPAFFPLFDHLGEPEWFNGPYCLVKKSKDRVILEKSSYYWDRQSIFFNRVKISCFSSPSEVFKEFQRGETDWLGAPFNWPQTPLPISHFKEKKLPRPYLIYLNTDHFPLSSPLIRRALSCVIDRHLIAKDIYIGTDPLFTLMPPSLSFCKNRAPNHDLSKGRELFEEGLKELGLTREKFPPLVLNFFDLSANKKLSEYLKEIWQKSFGIRVDLDLQEWNDFYQHLDQGAFQIAGTLKSPFCHDPLSFLESFCRKRDNHSLWSDDPYIVAFSALRKNPSKEAYLTEIEARLLSSMPAIPLFTVSHYYAHRPGLIRYVIDSEGGVDFRFASLENKPTLYRESPNSHNKCPLIQGDKSNEGAG